MHGSSTLKWSQTQLCRPSGYGMDLFLVPYSRVLRYSCVKRAQLIAEGYTKRHRHSWKLEWYWGVVNSYTRFFCILHVKNVVGILLANIVRKKQYITPFPHPLPSLKCVTHKHLAPIWLQPLKSSTQIVYAITFSFIVRFVWNFHTIFYTLTALF